MSAPPSVAHVAMPFARAGSAVTNVIRHLAREHARAGGTTYAVLSHDRDTAVRDAEPLYVDYRRHCPKEYFTDWQLRADHALGVAGLPRPYTGSLFEPAIEAVRAVSPDVVVVHEGYYATSALPRWRRALPDAGLFLYVHNPLSRAYLRHELRRLLQHADGVIFVSDHLRRHAAARVAMPLAAHVVHNGCLPVPPTEQQRSGLLFVGQVTPHKGPHLLIDAVRALRERGVVTTAIVVGSSVHGDDQQLSEYERALRRKAEAIPGAVSFTGFVPNERLATYYRGAEAVAVPSLWDESCPLVLLEALGFGTPVVATPRGGIPEVGADAVSYVATETGTAFADALEPILCQPPVAKDRQAAALRRAEELAWPLQYRQFMAAVSA